MPVLYGFLWQFKKKVSGEGPKYDGRPDRYVFINLTREKNGFGLFGFLVFQFSFRLSFYGFHVGQSDVYFGSGTQRPKTLYAKKTHAIHRKEECQEMCSETQILNICSI